MEKVDLNIFKKVSYGLYVLTSKSKGHDNGCIVNVVVQVTTSPLQVVLAVNKGNLTHDMMVESGLFNVNVLSEEASMEVFKHFGFQSGKQVDKFQDFRHCERSDNGLFFLNAYSCGFLSGKVTQMFDLGTHTLFIATVTESRVFSDTMPITYDFYQKYTKPGLKPTPSSAPKEPKKEATAKPKVWVCEICGYEYEGDELPDDFVCPICSHGKEAFTLQG